MAGLFGGWDEPAFDESEEYRGPTNGDMFGARMRDLSKTLTALAWGKAPPGGSEVASMRGKRITPYERARMKKLQLENQRAEADMAWTPPLGGATPANTEGGEQSATNTQGQLTPEEAHYVQNGGPPSEARDRYGEVMKKRLEFNYSENKASPDLKTAAAIFHNDRGGNRTWGARWIQLDGKPAAQQRLVEMYQERLQKGDTGKPPTLKEIYGASAGGNASAVPATGTVAADDTAQQPAQTGGAPMSAFDVEAANLPEADNGYRWVKMPDGSAAQRALPGSKADKMAAEATGKFANVQVALQDLNRETEALINYQENEYLAAKAADLLLGRINMDANPLLKLIDWGVGTNWADTRFGKGVNSPRWQVQNTLRSAAEGYYRTLTGAAMPDTEVASMMEQFVPGIMEGGDASRTKLTNLTSRVQVLAKAFNSLSDAEKEAVKQGKKRLSPLADWMSRTDKAGAESTDAAQAGQTNATQAGQPDAQGWITMPNGFKIRKKQ